MHSTDIAIIGAGPIGLELAVALKKAGVDYLHFDARQIGYTISWFAPQTRFFSSNERIAIAGVPLQTPDQTKATREQYLAYLRGVVEQYDLKIATYEPVIGISREDGRFVLTTQPAGGQKTYAARQLVLATGGTEKPRRLNIPGEDLPHVSHYFHDPHTYFRKRVLIVGGRNSAIEAALRCHQAGAYVSICYRRSEFNAKSIKYWLMPEMSGLIESGRIKAYFDTVPIEITPAEVRLERLGIELTEVGDRGPEVGNAKVEEDILSNPRSPIPDPQSPIPFDFVLLLIGYEADMSLCRMAGVELRGPSQTPVYDPRTMETNVRGLYLAGTVIGGTQERYAVFIENCHVHVDRILAALTGASPPPAPRPFSRPES